MPVVFLVDEHVPSEIVDGLRRRNIEVRTLNELNLLSMPDEKILAYATAHSFVVYTRDSDFLRLHTDGFKHNGIIYHHPLSYSVGEVIRRLVLVSDLLSTDELKNQIKFL